MITTHSNSFICKQTGMQHLPTRRFSKGWNRLDRRNKRTPLRMDVLNVHDSEMCKAQTDCFQFDGTPTQAMPTRGSYKYGSMGTNVSRLTSLVGWIVNASITTLATTSPARRTSGRCSVWWCSAQMMSHGDFIPKCKSIENIDRGSTCGEQEAKQSERKRYSWRNLDERRQRLLNID